VLALRAGRLVTGLSLTVAPGPAVVGPFPVPLPGFYTFQVVLGGQKLSWRKCLGSCGARAPASAGTFSLSGVPPTITPERASWRVTLHLSTNRPAAAVARASRGSTVVREAAFSADRGRNSAPSFLLAPGNYRLTLTAVDAFGRVRTLSWFAILAR
jgi:hypothetical protein